MEEKTKNGEHDEVVARGREEGGGNDREAQTAARGDGERAKITTNRGTRVKNERESERERERERERGEKRDEDASREERKEGRGEEARARGTHGDVKRNDAEGRGDAAGDCEWRGHRREGETLVGRLGHQSIDARRRSTCQRARR